ncbi:DUF3800 domain-containing protein [Patescibacteria group bacterium]|nr:DUF3800 domain-containing protein [Patescibacteria group bacterium]
MNANERALTELPDDFLIFIDEVGDPFLHRDRTRYDDPTVFPVMTVVAVAIEQSVYASDTVPRVNALKEKLFGTTSSHLHSREIRRKEGGFKVLLDAGIYESFKREMDNILLESRATLISSSINKLILLDRIERFERESSQPYNLGDIYLRNVDFVLERLGHFLKARSGQIVFETRGRSESRRVQGVLIDAKQKGTFYFSPERFGAIREEIRFFSKKDNIVGLQLADYCAYPFARHARNGGDKDNKFFDFLRQFIYKGGSGEYGLKEWS